MAAVHWLFLTLENTVSAGKWEYLMVNLMGNCTVTKKKRQKGAYLGIFQLIDPRQFWAEKETTTLEGKKNRWKRQVRQHRGVG